MSLWTRLKAVAKWLNKNHLKPGGIFDMQTYQGTFFALLFSIAATYVMWHFDDIFAWYRAMRGDPYEIDLAQQRWARLWALIIGGTGVAGAIMGMIAIPLNRYRARKSAKHQWYDKTDLTKEDVQGSGHGNGNSAKHNG